MNLWISSNYQWTVAVSPQMLFGIHVPGQGDLTIAIHFGPFIIGYWHNFNPAAPDTSKW